MGKIITPDNITGPIQAFTGRPEFSLIAISSFETDLKIKGTPEDIMRMIGQAMASNDHITKTVITTVIIFLEEKGIALEDIKKHSYLP